MREAENGAAANPPQASRGAVSAQNGWANFVAALLEGKRNFFFLQAVAIGVPSRLAALVAPPCRLCGTNYAAHSRALHPARRSRRFDALGAALYARTPYPGPTGTLLSLFGLHDQGTGSACPRYAKDLRVAFQGLGTAYQGTEQGRFSHTSEIEILPVNEVCTTVLLYYYYCTTVLLYYCTTVLLC